MNQSFGQIISILAASIVLFLLPVYLFSQQQDLFVQSYVWEETAEFAEMVKNNGYISKNMYEKYLKALQSTRYLYEIKMTHKHKLIHPIYDEEGHFTDQIHTTYENHSESEILSAIYDKNADYFFRQEDYLSIEVKNKTKTLAEKMHQALLGREIKNTISITYGGLIRDEIE